MRTTGPAHGPAPPTRSTWPAGSLRIGVRPTAWTPVPVPAGRWACGSLATAIFGLALADLVSAPLCLVAAAVLGVIAWNLPRVVSSRWRDWPGRSPAAVLLLVAIAIVGWATVPAAAQDSLFPASGLFGSLDVGTLAALATGALVAVGLECGERRGLRSGLMLSIAVLALTTVSLPGPNLLPALLICWPATLLALARVAAAAGVTEGVREPVTAPVTPGAGTGARVRPLVAEARRTLVPLVAATVAAGVLFAVAIWVRPDVGVFGGGGGGGLGGDAFGGNRNAGTYLGGSMNLRRRGGLSDDPVAEVPSDSPRLWRAATLDVYTGSSWTSAGAAGSTAEFTGAGRVSVTPPLGSTPSADPRISTVHVVGDLRQAIAPGQLLGVDAPELRFAVPRSGDALDLGTSFRFQAPSQYRVTYATVPDADSPSFTAGSATGTGPATGAGTATGSGSATGAAREAENPDPVYTLLPPSTTARVRTLGETLVAAAPDRLAAVRAVEQAVRARMVYRLDSPVPRLDADAVDDALFESRSGFCEQFASAAAVLLRAGGVPTRVAVGFSGGEQDGDHRTLRQSDAHAWIEVWFPGTGWVSADPTPPGDLAQSWFSSVRTSVQAAVRAAQRLFLVHGPWLPIVVILGAAAVLALPGLIRRLRAGSREPSTLDPRLATAFAQLERSLHRSGAPRGPDETVAALAVRLDLPALLVLERALYAPVPPSPGECADAAREIEAAAR